MLKVYHLSHIDLDGYSCQLLSSKAYDNIEFYNANYGSEVIVRLKMIIERIKINNIESLILITDLNLSQEEAKYLDDEVALLNKNGFNIKIQLLDHHKSGEETASIFAWYHLDINKSASLLTYDYISNKNKEKFSLFIRAVNAFDLWKIEDKEYFEFAKVCMRLINETIQLNRYMFLFEDNAYKLFVLEEAISFMKNKNSHILLDNNIHKIKKKFFQDKDDDTLDNLATKKILNLLKEKADELIITYRGYKGILTYSLGNSSILGNAVLKNIPNIDFFMSLSRSGSVSLRADNNIDVSVFAFELAKGGGHPNASGCRISSFKEGFSYQELKKNMQELLLEKEKISSIKEKN